MQPTTNQNKIIIGTVIGLAVVLGAVGIYKWQKAKNATPTVDQTQTTQTTQSGKPTFAQFLAANGKNGSYKCTVTQNVGGTASNGIVYLYNGMIRGDFTTTAQGMNITGSSIIRDGFSYTWSSMTPDGIKIPVQTGSGASGFVQVSGGTYSWNADQVGNYECAAWTPDTNLFAIPTNITFRELETKG